MDRHPREDECHTYEDERQSFAIDCIGYCISFVNRASCQNTLHCPDTPSLSSGKEIGSFDRLHYVQSSRTRAPSAASLERRHVSS